MARIELARVIYPSGVPPLKGTGGLVDTRHAELWYDTDEGLLHVRPHRSDPLNAHMIYSPVGFQMNAMDAGAVKAAAVTPPASVAASANRSRSAAVARAVATMPPPETEIPELSFEPDPEPPPAERPTRSRTRKPG